MRSAVSPLICDAPEMPVGQQCAVCGCTEDDCRDCIIRTGIPCHWVAINLCSACAPAVLDGGAT